MKSIIDASKEFTFPASIDLVISNFEKAEGLIFAKSNNIKTHFIRKIEFEKKIIRLLKEENIEIICLAGFLQIISKNFVNKWKNRILNIHPSYLPHFKGLNPQKQAINAGASFSGCSVHFINEHIDDGKIILQKKVFLNDDEDIESLTKKILKEEHIIYPKALKIVANKILKRKN